MCGFTVGLLDFDKLSASQKKELLKNYRKKRDSLQTHLDEVSESLKGINRALKEIEKKTK
jgi:hypothetical protein